MGRQSRLFSGKIAPRPPGRFSLFLGVSPCFLFLRRIFLALALGLTALSSWAERTITDQLNRQVSIPDQVERAVILQHQTLNLAAQLNAMPQAVGVLASWKKQLGADFARLAPGVEKLATPGDLKEVNLESLLALKPDVVFVTNYFPPEMLDKLEAAKIPVVAISLRSGDKAEAAKLNPTLGDEDQAYSDGLREGIRLVAEVFGKQKAGEELTAAAFATRPLLAERLGDMPAEKRVRAYMANPDLGTYGSGKYTGLMMEHAGAFNVAAPTVKGFKQVSMEEVLGWNPAIIFVQDRYPQVIKEIKEGA